MYILSQYGDDKHSLIHTLETAFALFLLLAVSLPAICRESGGEWRDGDRKRGAVKGNGGGDGKWVLGWEVCAEVGSMGGDGKWGRK